MVHEQLADVGLVDFADATEVIDRFLGFEFTVPWRTEVNREATRDLMHLNAVEAMLPPLGNSLPEPPMHVPALAANFAILASNSGPFVMHDIRADPQLWDVTLLGSDASKLSWLLGSTSVQKLRDEFDGVIARLNETHLAFRSARLDASLEWGDLSRAIDQTAEASVRGWKATLWRGKIAVLLGESIATNELTKAFDFS